MKHRQPVIQGMLHVMQGNLHRGRKAFLVAGFVFPTKSAPYTRYGANTQKLETLKNHR